MSTSMASASLSEVRIDRPRRHTQGPVELAIAHRTPKVSTKSNPDLYQNQFKLTQQYDEKVHPKMGRRSDFVYVNTAYVGSADNINTSRLAEPPTSVIREQYWACSRWPYTQRILAIAVGVLLGAVIGMVVTFVMRNADQDNILPGFLMGRPAPD